jgi:hypothetical protein
MAITYTQAQVDAAVNYLLTGGPNGGQLTLDQFRHEIGYGVTFCQPNDFTLKLQLAINQGHAGLANCTLLARDQWGTVIDVISGWSFAGWYAGPGPQNSTFINVISGYVASIVNRLGVSISG